jgi:hypothetical protein
MLFLCLTNLALLHESVWRSGHIDPHFLDLGTSCSWVVRFTLRQLYPRGKSPRYPLYRRLDSPRAGLDDVEKRKFLTLSGLELRTLGRQARSQSLCWLRYPGSFQLGFMTKNLLVLFVFHMGSTCHALYILFALVILIQLGEEYEL